jgi:hypothetical protein
MPTLTHPRAEVSRITGRAGPTVMERRKMHLALEYERAIGRERSRRTSPKTARTSPKPPVSARIAPPLRRPRHDAGRLDRLAGVALAPTFTMGDVNCIRV